MMTTSPTMLFGTALLLAVAALGACAAPAEDVDADDATAEEATGTRSDAQIKQSGSGVRSQRELEADGYTCRNWPGTTVTECTKFGSPTYTCDSAGRCAQLREVRPIPTIGPIPTVVAPFAP